MIKNPMKNIDVILSNELFRESMSAIGQLEQDREFCRHGMAHLLDVARIACLMAAESDSPPDKEVIYAAALLHDIGRAVQYETGEDHEKAGMRISEQILKDCSFTDDQRQQIISAVGGHRAKEGQHHPLLLELISKADHLSRLCFCCGVRERCYWPDEKKNRTIYY